MQKHLSNKKWRKDKERLLDLDTEQQKALKFILREKDKELKAEEVELKSYGVCPECNWTHSPAGQCINQVCVVSRLDYLVSMLNKIDKLL